jgi:hypothetical protein
LRKSERGGQRFRRWKSGKRLCMRGPLAVAFFVAVVAMSVLGAGCAGGGGERERRAEPRAETKQKTERRTDERLPAREDGARPRAGAGREEGDRALVWVGVEDGDEIALVDVVAGKVVARYEAPGGPHNVTVAENGVAAVALYGSDRLAVVRPGGVRFVELGGSPHDVKSSGRLFVVANEAALRLDFVAGGEHVASVPLAGEPHDLAIAPSGKLAWVTLNGTDELAVVDVRARRVVRYVATGRRPHDVLFAPDGTLWATDWEGPVHVFDRRGNLRAEVDLGEESHHLAFTPDGREAWVTDHAARRVFVVDADRVEVLAALPVPGGPHHVAITPDGKLAAVADHERGTVVVYDVERRSRVRTIEVGPGPHGVWAVPAKAGS